MTRKKHQPKRHVCHRANQCGWLCHLLCITCGRRHWKFVQVPVELTVDLEQGEVDMKAILTLVSTVPYSVDPSVVSLPDPTGATTTYKYWISAGPDGVELPADQIVVGPTCEFPGLADGDYVANAQMVDTDGNVFGPAVSADFTVAEAPPAPVMVTVQAPNALVVTLAADA